MLTRIISGAVMIAILIGILVLGAFYPVVLTAFLGIIAAIACYEILNNTGVVKKKTVTFTACAYAVLAVFAYGGYFENIWSGFFGVKFFTVIYAALVAFAAIYFHKDLNFTSIACALSFPVVISYAFSTLATLYIRENGVFYLLLLLNFSSICDCGAYFTGVFLGKHKLCPEISPKKTIEGAVGGIVSSLICSLILCFAFSKTASLLHILIATVPFCIIGMCGDLFASCLKRSVNLKDYGKLIPGHGGILDRFDSILLIAPVLSLFVSGGLF